MKARNYLIFTILLIWIFTANTYAAESLSARKSLAGIKAIAVIVEQINPKANMYGLSEQALRNDTALKLRSKEIAVFSKQQHPQTSAMPQLHINVNVVLREDIKFSAASIHLTLKQAVSLKRDPQTACLATTWETSDISMGQPADLKNVRKNVQTLVDRFLKDYLAANPQQKRNTKRHRNRRDQDEIESQHIQATVGRDFIIALATNPSTGYSWQLAKPLSRMLKLQNKKYIADKPQLIGSGGTEEWTFKPVHSGRATIVLEYVPPAAGSPSPIKRRTFIVTIARGQGIGAPAN